MADVTISYGGQTIASLSDSGTEVLETSGTFLTDDITIDYVKSGGGTKTVTVYRSMQSGEYTVAYVDADGNAVQTRYDVLDPNYTGSATIIAKSGSPLVIFEQSVVMDRIGNPTNVSTFFSETISTSERPPSYIYFFVYIVD